MPLISEAQIAEIRRQVADGNIPRGRYDLSPLQTRAEVFGYCVQVARQEGWDEVEIIDGLVKIATPWREDVREVEVTLRSLGYTKVSDYLRSITRHLSRKPPRQAAFDRATTSRHQVAT
jgi:hypothetical protein